MGETAFSDGPARALSRGHRIQVLSLAALVVSGLINALALAAAWHLSKAPDRVLVFDPTSGTTVVTSLVDPASDKEILEDLTAWAIMSLWDRTAAGPEHERLIKTLFLSDASKKAMDEWNSVKEQYAQKNLRSHARWRSADVQSIGIGKLRATVTADVEVTGQVNDEPIDENHRVTVAFDLVRNPNPYETKRFALAVLDYHALSDVSQLAKK